MVVAGEDVLDPERDEVEPAGWGGTVDIDAGRLRRLPEGYLALAARGPDIAEALVVLAKKSAPVLGNVEAAMMSSAQNRTRLASSGNDS